MTFVMSCGAEGVKNHFKIVYHQNLLPFSLSLNFHLTENVDGRSSGEPYGAGPFATSGCCWGAYRDAPGEHFRLG